MPLYETCLAGNAAVRSDVQPTLDAIPGWRYTSQPYLRPATPPPGPAPASPPRHRADVRPGRWRVVLNPMRDVATRIAQQAGPATGP